MQVTAARNTRARPHLYTEDEVRQLLDAALELPVAWPSTPLRPRVFYCLIGLLSVTGLLQTNDYKDNEAGVAGDDFLSSIHPHWLTWTNDGQENYAILWLTI